MSPTFRFRPFYGFYVAFACFVTLFMHWGMFVNSFGIFFKPIAQDLGVGRGALAMALLMRSVGTAISAPIAGRMIDRYGARRMMTIGSVLMGGGLLLACRATSMWQLDIIFFFIGCGLMCSTMIPCALLISNWFVSRRATALAATFVGTGVGGMIIAPVATWIILNYGWRTAFAVAGGTTLLVVIPLIVLLIRNRPSDVGLEPYRLVGDDEASADDSWGVDVREALVLPAYWKIAAIMFLIGLVTNGIHNHSVAFLTDVGHSPTRAAFAWSVVMAVMIGGKLAFGPAADWWGAKNAMAGAFVMLSVSIVALLFARNYGFAMVFACIYGFACGAPLTLYPLMTANNLGMKHFGAIYGILVIVGSVGSMIGPVAPGIVFDRFGTYVPVFYVFVVLTVVGAVCSVSIKPAPQRPAPVSRSQVTGMAG